MKTDMPKPSQTARWLSGMRANFLVLPVMLVSIGGAAAWRDGVFSPVPFVLTMAGVVLAHISVNLFNEYSDWRTGIDANTVRTPFSGGSGNLPAGLLPPSQVRAAAWGTLGAAGVIGLWLAVKAGWPVVVMMGVGGVAAVFYTELLARVMLGELMSGLTLGSLVVLGAYYVQAGDITGMVLIASVPPGILTMLLLLLNEFPDAEADRAGGRRHIVIVLGYRAASWVYAVLMLSVYAVIGIGVITGALPKPLLLGLLTLPLASAAIIETIRFSGKPERLQGAQGKNVGVVLATDLLLAVGFLLA